MTNGGLEPPATGAGGDVLSVGGRPVLVVDDDPLVLAMIARVLRAHGVDVVTASGGRDALRVLYGLAPSPCVLLTDVNMPGMNGIELAARVRAERPGVGIVLMTSDTGMRDEALRRPELVGAVLLKPFGIDELVDAVTSAILGRGGRTDLPAGDGGETGATRGGGTP